jgi:hypothetical protein
VTVGNVSLGNRVATLNYVTNLSPSFGSTPRLDVILNDGTGTSSGNFAGLPQGAEVPTMAGFGGQPHRYIS